MDEDDAIHQTIKEDSVHKLGFFGPNFEYLYILTHIETFSLWRAEDAEQISRYDDVRTNVESMQSKAFQMHVDYAIDCQYIPSLERLILYVGNQSGDIAILNTNITNLEPVHILRGAHSDIVRGVHWNVEAFTTEVCVEDRMDIYQQMTTSDELDEDSPLEAEIEKELELFDARQADFENGVGENHDCNLTTEDDEDDYRLENLHSWNELLTALGKRENERRIQLTSVLENDSDSLSVVKHVMGTDEIVVKVGTRDPFTADEIPCFSEENQEEAREQHQFLEHIRHLEGHLQVETDKWKEMENVQTDIPNAVHIKNLIQRLFAEQISS
ncbi:WD repeat-containing protein 89 [Quaeritorhiza haematococci]|nr:WD repeat-containing protein 89 [Quaeritorhiza haematococci]